MAHPLGRILAGGLGKRSCCLGILSRRRRWFPLLYSCLMKSDSAAPPVPPKKILGLSTLLLQDGLDIDELPIIIRRTNNTMLPFSSLMGPVEDVRTASVEDETFKDRLQQCSSWEHVFQLLDIPGDEVTGYTASYALQRICQLKEAGHGWADLDTFICTAVMNELYSTVRKEVSTLSNGTLLPLVKCILNSESFSTQCAESVTDEIQRRIGDSQFDISELCMLSRTLQASPKYSELVSLIWVHIGNRREDIDISNVAEVCDLLPPSQKYITKKIEKQLKMFWWKLSGDDIISVLGVFARTNVFNGAALKNIGQWVNLNIHDMKETDLIKILTIFIQFQFSDASLIRALERYIPAKGSKMDANVLALAVEYCRGRRYLSPRILDAAATHFCDNESTYSCLQIYMVLRSFGYLNYLPHNSSWFLTKVEEVLGREFSNFGTMQIIELLCSFSYVKRVPVNFAHKILTTTFLVNLEALNTDQRLQAGHWLETFQSAIMLETSGVRLPVVFKVDSGTYRWKMSEKKFLGVFEDLFPASHFLWRTFARNTIYTLDFVMHVKDRKSVPISNSSFRECDTRLAFLIHSPSHYSINTQQLLGEHSMMHRHLSILKFSVIELPSNEFMSCLPAKRKQYLQAKMNPYIDF